MSNPLIKLTFALQLSNTKELPLGPKLAVGSAVKEPLHPNAVFEEIISTLASELATSEIASFTVYDKLRQQLRTYGDKHNDTLDAKLRDRSELLVTLLFLKSYPKHNGPIILPEGTEYLTDDLSLSLDGSKKLSCEKYITLVFDSLRRYLESPVNDQGPILQKGCIDSFIDILRDYVEESPLWDQDRLRGELLYKDLLYLANARSKFETGIKKLKQGISWSGHSLYVQGLLQKLERKNKTVVVSDDEMLMITDQRDRLFVEAKLLRYLLRLLQVTIQLAQGISTYGARDDVKLKETERENQSGANPLIIYERENIDFLGLGLELAVNRAGKRIARSGITAEIRPLLARLIAYKKNQDDANDERIHASYERFVSVLEMNELHAAQKQCLRKWEKVKFCSEALVEDLDVDLEQEGYIQQRRHNILLELGRVIHKEIEHTMACKVKERFRRQEEVAVLCFNVLNAIKEFLFSEEDLNTYVKISGAIEFLLKNRKGKRADYENYKQIWFHGTPENSNTSRDMGWKTVDVDTFRNMRELNRTTWSGEMSMIRRMLSEVEQTPVTSRTDSVDVVPEHPNVRKPVRHGARKGQAKLSGIQRRIKSLQEHPSSLGDTNEVQQGVNRSNEEALPTEQLQQLSLADRRPKVAPEQNVPKIVFMYHSRVLRWFQPVGSVHDPFVSDPSYRYETSQKKITWNRIKHNFAYAVDSYIGYGIENQDKKALSRMRLTKQIQILGMISLHSDQFKETRQGVFGYSVSLKGKCIHRCFTRVASERIQSEYMEKGWLQLSKLESSESEMPRGHAAASDVEQLDDGSRLLRETENVVVIEDPKNNATITLVKMF